EGAFFFRLRHLNRQLGPRRQLAQDRALGPAQDERSDQRPQCRARGGIATLHWAREAICKALARAKEPGVDGADQAPQLLEVSLTTGLAPFSARSGRSAIPCAVLPSPMSSARHAPISRRASRESQTKPSR